MTQKCKHGSRKRKNTPAGWVKRKPKRKGINTSPGFTKLIKTWGRMFIKLFYREVKHGRRTLQR